jgi:hypothetical protein
VCRGSQRREAAQCRVLTRPGCFSRSMGASSWTGGLGNRASEVAARKPRPSLRPNHGLTTSRTSSGRRRAADSQKRSVAAQASGPSLQGNTHRPYGTFGNAQMNQHLRGVPANLPAARPG